jgi:rubrerythrin
MANDRRARTEKRFRRLLGASEETRKYQKCRLNEMIDWWGICRKCGKKLNGTPAQIAAHVCGETDEASK